MVMDISGSPSIDGVVESVMYHPETSEDFPHPSASFKLETRTETQSAARYFFDKGAIPPIRPGMFVKGVVTRREVMGGRTIYRVYELHGFDKKGGNREWVYTPQSPNFIE